MKEKNLQKRSFVTESGFRIRIRIQSGSTTLPTKHSAEYGMYFILETGIESTGYPVIPPPPEITIWSPGKINLKINIKSK
jgi:hypothetical protein